MVECFFCDVGGGVRPLHLILLCATFIYFKQSRGVESSRAIISEWRRNILKQLNDCQVRGEIKVEELINNFQRFANQYSRDDEAFSQSTSGKWDILFYWAYETLMVLYFILCCVVFSFIILDFVCFYNKESFVLPFHCAFFNVTKKLFCHVTSLWK